MQTQQLADLLAGEGAIVTLVQVNAPYQPDWIGRLRIVRALFRLVLYMIRVWRCAGKVDLVHVMANSGWSWHLFATPAIWIARARAVPVVVNYRGGEAATFLARSARWVRGSLAAANVVAVPSEFLREIFARYGIASEVLPNIVDLARFPFAPHVPRSAPHLVVTRNLEDIYDIPTALRAFARLRAAVPDARLSIAGSGPELANLRSVSRSLGIAEAVRFLGRLDRDAVVALYADADLMLNPSRVDNMPNSVLEGLACGLPVVSTRAGGVPFIVRDEASALLVDVGDDEAMAAAALRIIRDAELAQRLAATGIVEVQQYTWVRVRPRLFELYQRVLPAGETRVTAT